jgi:hypothetical protein
MENSGVNKLQSIDDLIDLNIRITRMANVKYVLMDSPNKNTNLLLTNVLWALDGKQHYLYYVKGYFPRVGFFRSAVPVAPNSDALAYLGDPAFDYQKQLIVNGPAVESGTNSTAVVPQQILSYRPWKVTASVNAPTDGWVLFDTKYETDWAAYVDGKKTKAYPADYLLTGVPVTSGVHNVEFRFEPESLPFLVSLITALAGLLAAAVYGLTRIGKTRKPDEQGPAGQNTLP